MGAKEDFRNLKLCRHSRQLNHLGKLMVRLLNKVDKFLKECQFKNTPVLFRMEEFLSLNNQYELAYYYL